MTLRTGCTLQRPSGILAKLKPMFIRRLQNLPILYLLIISLLINSAVTSGYVWGIAADKSSCRQEAISAHYASDNYVENAAYRWGDPRTRQGHQPGSLLAGITPTTVVVPVPPVERHLNTHRIVTSPPRTPDHILHHRTIVLLI